MREFVFTAAAAREGRGRGFRAGAGDPGVRARIACGRLRPRRSSPTARFADESCAILTSPKFKACHGAVGPLPYLQNCRYDVCSCTNGRDCLCDAVANYAAACARRGVRIGWREPSFCGECPPRPPPFQRHAT